MNNNSEETQNTIDDNQAQQNEQNFDTSDGNSLISNKEMQSVKSEEVNVSNSENSGAYLKSVRQEKGISLETIHEATKIPLDALRAIEEGYKIRILTPFYLNGFIKIYAKYLDVEVPEVSKVSPKEKLPQHIKSSYDEFDFQQWISSRLTRKRKQQITIVCGVLLVLFILFKVFSFFANRPEKVKKVKKVKVTAVEKKIVKKTSQTQSTQTVKRQAANTSPVQVITSGASEAKNVVLTVRAKQKSWLRVKADAEVVFQSTLREGAVETWKADKQIEIAGRNINELEFELNGKTIGALGRANRKANRIIITKDGLSVLK